MTGIPADVPGTQQQWLAAVASAQSSPAGKARIALAAAIGQLPGWGLAPDGSPTPVPADHDVDGVEQGMYLALAGGPLPYLGQAVSSRRTIEQLAGGNPSWNTGVDYARQSAAAAPEQRNAVRRLYERAGLDLPSFADSSSEMPEYAFVASFVPATSGFATAPPSFHRVLAQN